MNPIAPPGIPMAPQVFLLLLAAWLAGRLAGWLAGWLAGLLAGWRPRPQSRLFLRLPQVFLWATGIPIAPGCLAGRLPDWLAGWLASPASK